MALKDAIAGAKRPSQSISLTDDDGVIVDLTGATITARIKNEQTEVAVASDGVFTVTSAAGGVFRWDYGTTDVAVAGRYQVQFTLAYGSDPTPAKTFTEGWIVTRSI